MSPALAQIALEQLGPVIFNLYGTSEAGFAILGTPALLGRKPASIDQSVWGVRTKIVNHADQKVSHGKIGRLCICSAWSTHQKSWIETGDLAYQDPEGDIFLCGRVDRYQMPAVIEFRDNLPYTALGKLDMKSLRE